MKTLGIGLAGARYIDVVDICVPPALHHSFAMREADAGKHIIKENPLTGFLERTAIPCLSERECRGLACEKARATMPKPCAGMV